MLIHLYLYSPSWIYRYLLRCSTLIYLSVIAKSVFWRLLIDKDKNRFLGIDNHAWWGLCCDYSKTGQLIYIKTFSWKNAVPGTVSAIGCLLPPQRRFSTGDDNNWTTTMALFKRPFSFRHGLHLFSLVLPLFLTPHYASCINLFIPDYQSQLTALPYNLIILIFILIRQVPCFPLTIFSILGKQPQSQNQQLIISSPTKQSVSADVCVRLLGQTCCIWTM